LARVPLFASLGPDEVHALDTGCVWRRVRAGDWVVNDNPGIDVYFVVSGHVHAVILSSGREVILGDVRDGEYFNAVSAIDGKLVVWSVRAVTDTVIARMKSAAFRREIDRHPDVRDGVFAALARLVRRLVTRSSEHALLHAHGRLCAELLRLSRTSAQGRLVVSPPPTHAELAARIDTRREAVTRLLKTLELEGAIARTRSAIVLVNPDHLRRIIAGPGDRGAH
jgi:CRP-like cAMP-binding protein